MDSSPSSTAYVGDGVDPMDLLPFIGKEGNALYLMGNTRVEFPSDLYPPSWDERFVLQNAITEAGKASKRKLSLFNKPGVLVWTTCLESHVTRTGQKHTGTELPRSVPWQMPTTDTMKASNATALPITNKNLRHDSSEFPSCSGASDAMRVETKRSRVSIAVYPFGA